jgi:hypothetical protein
LQNDNDVGLPIEPLVDDPKPTNDDGCGDGGGGGAILKQVIQEAPNDLKLRRLTRLHQPSNNYSHHDYVLITDGEELECFDKAMSYEKNG